MAWAANFDDSGTHRSRSFTLAGLVAPVADWEVFSSAWEDAMAAGGAADRTLHMKYVLHGRKGTTPDEDWSDFTTEEQRRGLFSQLAPVLTSHVTYACSVTVPVKDFDELLREGPRREQINPTVFCMRSCLDFIIRQVRPSAEDPLACVFHVSGEREPDMIRFYKVLRKERGWEAILPATVPLFLPACGVPPLQGADLFARESGDYWLSQRIAPDGRDRRELIRILDESGRFKTYYVPRQALERESAQLEGLKRIMPDNEYVEAMHDFESANREMQRDRDPNFGKPKEPKK